MPRPRGADNQAGDAIDVDTAVDALYIDDPDDFTAARDDLARRLRAAGRRDDAVAVKALRRPTVAAWAVNRVARRRAADVTRLRAIGDDLGRAQTDLLRGGAGGGRADAARLRELGGQRRAAASALVEAALAVLAERGTTVDPHRDDIVATFDAVAADQAAADAVAAARLARPLEAPVGLGAPDAEIFALAEGPTPATPRTGKRSTRGASSDGDGTGSNDGDGTGSTPTGRVHVLDAAEVRKARARAARAHDTAEAAAREVARLEAALTTARREAARAKEAAARADAAARAADAAADRAPG